MKREIKHALQKLLDDQKIPYGETYSNSALLRAYFTKNSIPFNYEDTEDELLAKFILGK